VTTFDEMDARLRAYPQRLEGELRRAMDTSLLLLEIDMRRLVPKDTRQLTGSINHQVEGSGTNLVGRVGPSLAYALFVERGRRPGRYPPIAAIQGWARRHGIPPFLLARKIARRGTRPQPFVAPSIERNLPRITALFERVGVRMTEFLAGHV
jgi:hypothetical protein